MFKVNFMANQSVTAEDLNDIIYNLGYDKANTEFETFEDNREEPYGIDDLNAITSNVVGKGVKREYGDMCAVSLDGTTVTIHSGQAFFENGATMTIDEEGVSLELEDATLTNYVYLFHNTALNVAGARCTPEIPSGIDAVLLAEITDGKITQNLKRFCKSKIDAKNTPVVALYNNTECEFGLRYDGDGIIEEFNLSDVNVQLSDCVFARISGSTYGHQLTDGGSDRWYKTPMYAMTDFTIGLNLVRVYPSVSSPVEYNYGDTFSGYTFWISVVDYGLYGKLQGVKIEYDINNNKIRLYYGRRCKIGQGDIVIELFSKGTVI